jgi:hypothetical protein
MNVQESTIYTKYIYLAPKGSRIPKKKFHELFEIYVKHPELKDKLIKKLRRLSIEQGLKNSKKNKQKNKQTIKNKSKPKQIKQKTRKNIMRVHS